MEGQVISGISTGNIITWRDSFKGLTNWCPLIFRGPNGVYWQKRRSLWAGNDILLVTMSPGGGRGTGQKDYPRRALDRLRERVYSWINRRELQDSWKSFLGNKRGKRNGDNGDVSTGSRLLFLGGRLSRTKGNRPGRLSSLSAQSNDKGDSVVSGRAD